MILEFQPLDRFSPITKKAAPFVDGDVIALCDWQDPEERLLQCWHCYNVWLDWVPRRFPLKRYPCDCCNNVGNVTMGMNRRDEE